MVVEPTTQTVASRCWMETRRICLELADGRCVSFPAAKYPLLARVPQNLLEQVQLRLHGLALRWEELDEDELHRATRKVVHPVIRDGQKVTLTEHGAQCAQIVPMRKIDRRAACEALMDIGPVEFLPRT